MPVAKTTMGKRAYLYRRNGTYYFRWSIPLAYRLRLAAGSPGEVRISLGTTRNQVARHPAARYWLGALDATQHFLVSPRPIRCNDLVEAIQ